MNHDDAQGKVYHRFLKTINDESLLGDELAALAAQDALMEAYGLEGAEEPMPHLKKRRAGRPVSRGKPEGKPSCRA